LKGWARARSRGPADLAVGLALRLRENIASDDALLFLARATGPQPTLPEGISFFVATKQDGRRYARDIGTDSPATFAARLGPHTRCFLAAEGERLLHASWVTTCAAWTRELRRYVHPPPGSAYVYESFTDPAARGRGIYPAALRALASWLAERDIPRLWVAVEEDNFPSLKAVSKAGFAEQFVVRYVRRAGRLSIDLPAESLTSGWRFTSRAPTAQTCTHRNLGGEEMS
jgi:ribosomal protein S18 acetylase RimI-like enzyme